MINQKGTENKRIFNKIETFFFFCNFSILCYISSNSYYLRYDGWNICKKKWGKRLKYDLELEGIAENVLPKLSVISEFQKCKLCTNHLNFLFSIL